MKIIFPRQILLFVMLLAGIYTSAWFFQASLFINWDVGYLLNSAQMLLAGGSYSSDFFAPNPPVILYLYLPPLITAKAFHLEQALVFRLYIFMVASLSLGLCFFVARKIFRKEDSLLAGIFMLTLAVIFLIIPSYDFGQRDHLLVILAMPYFLLMACRLSVAPFASRSAIVIGLLAGSAFAMKPQFLITPLLLELYYGIRRKNYFAAARAEVLVLLGVLVLHALIILALYPDYFSVVVPYLLRNYYNSIGNSWSELLLNNLALYCYFPFLFYGAEHKKNPYKELSRVLLLVLLGFLISYVSQRTTFYYHIVPPFSVALLLMTLYCGLFISRPRLTPVDYGVMGLGSLLLFLFLWWRVKIIWTITLFAPVTYFSFFGLLFAVLLYAAQMTKTFGRVVGSLLVILAVGFLCSYLSGRTPSYAAHQFAITTLSLLVVFALMVPRDRHSLSGTLMIASLSVLVFAYPVFFSYCIYWRSENYKEKVLKPLIVFMQTQPAHRSIYVFSLRGNYGSPLFEYTGSRLVQRLDCLWPTLGFVKQAALGKPETLQNAEDKTFFINLIADDLHRHQPDLVFVDREDTKLAKWDAHFDYLSYLSQNENFRAEWKAYHLTHELQAYPFYKLGVYEREKNKGELPYVARKKNSRRLAGV